jgi:ABC-type multidrug transport system fused ATPase/permease subunit
MTTLALLPPPLAAIAAMLLGAGVPSLGLLAVHRFIPHAIRSVHNDVAGFVLAIVGVIYAVLLAFIAVAVWQSFGQAEDLVQTEANLVGNLYRDTSALPEPAASSLRNDLFVYAETVVQDEWPELSAGRLDDAAGWQLLDRFHTTLFGIRTENQSITLLQADMGSRLDRLYDARRGRFHVANASLPSILWWNLVGGAVILMGFTYLFGVPNLQMHVAMVALLGALIGLVLALILLLNKPFEGRSHVSVEPFEKLVHSVESMAYPRR